ncbi:MAG TPA: 3-hydroxyacyl-CoA dehydrogenase NAD-binding domain-containing protein, partial [Turneriella sp.]|nr:3-hydroxyacyl-CoA dehydrogenase NAD-binding domain-containing protein [Turneriella sp.]
MQTQSPSAVSHSATAGQNNPPLQKILIAGGGAMGAGIAYIFARSYPEAQVDVMDTNEKVRIQAAESFEKWAAKDKERDEKAGKTFVDTNGRLNILAGFGKA